MRLRRTCLIQFLALTIAAMPALAQEAPRPPRPMLMVATFETDRTGWMPPPHLGDTLAELLTDRLVTAGTYRMMDRVRLVSASDSQHGIPLDALLDRAASTGVDYLVAGSVTRLSKEEHGSTGGGVLPLPFIGGLLKKHKTESVVGLTIRVIDVHTGEVVATATAESGASESHASGGGVAVIGHVPIVGGKGSSASGVLDGLLDKAVQQAVTAAAEKLVAAAPRLAREGGSGRPPDGPPPHSPDPD